ncbi:MAG TPA: PilN domain-containing protein [Bryobacteraceae bacterium]|nr:PilN domain-containing protein [Bryobacteraceae bacterium]
MGSSGIRRLLAIGSGIGIEIGRDDLTVIAARVRPSGARLLGAATIANFRGRAAAEWGAIYADFIKRAGAGHRPATVLLPRDEVIVRVLALPGVADRDLDSAIQLQLDTLHPFPEDQAVACWARLGKGGAVLVAIARRDVLDRYIGLFAEAGVKVAGFTFSGAVLYSAARLLNTPPAGGFLAFAGAGPDYEAYGESEAKPLFSAVFDEPVERASELASAELRLPPETQPLEIRALLPVPAGAPEEFDLSRDALAYAAALAGACSRLALPVNLLPAQYRSAGTRWIYVPTAALAALVLGALAALIAIQPVEDRKYMRAIQTEIRKLEPRARQSGALDRAIQATRARTQLLDDFRRRSHFDLDAVGELTKLLQPPVFLRSLEVSRDAITLNGSAEESDSLLKTLDESKLFEGSKFTVPLTRNGKLENFRIRSLRKEGAK